MVAAAPRSRRTICCTFFDVSFLRPAVRRRGATQLLPLNTTTSRVGCVFVVGVFLVAAPIALDGRMDPSFLTKLDELPPLLRRRRAALALPALDAIFALRTLANRPLAVLWHCCLTAPPRCSALKRPLPRGTELRSGAASSKSPVALRLAHYVDFWPPREHAPEIQLW